MGNFAVLWVIARDPSEGMGTERADHVQLNKNESDHSPSSIE
jgi:hypothetical protein